MDRSVVDVFRRARIDPDPAVSLPSIAVAADAGEILALDDEVGVISGGHAVVVRLGRIESLCTGNAVPPSLSPRPPPEYTPFFAVIERTAADYCSLSGRKVTDKEFERLYDLLRRRPDESDAEPLFEFLQAAARLYLSLCDVSRAEFEAVARRLAQSARTFSEGYSSRNYWEHALAPLLGAGRE